MSKKKIETYMQQISREFREEHPVQTKVPFWEANLNPITMKSSEKPLFSNVDSSRYLQSNTMPSGSVNGAKIIS